MNAESYNAGIYLRLSNDDRTQSSDSGESHSIENQKMLLTKYVKEHGWNLGSAYIDGDDIIGLNQKSL